MPNVYNSPIAKVLGVILRSPDVAITLGQTAYYSCEKKVVDERWRCHEDAHKDQWAELGAIKYITLYLLFLIRYGYEKNPFEIEAHNRSDDYKLPGYVPKPD